MTYPNSPDIKTFIKARIKELGETDPFNIAIRKIIDLDDQWPVLLETPPEFVGPTHGSGINSIEYTMVQRLEFVTNREYVARFGRDAPTSPIMRVLAEVWADHTDFREEWRLV